MKKLTAFFMSLVLVFGLTACGANGNPSSTSSASSSEPAVSSSEPSESEPETQTGKTLVVYYSASGNTKRVAEDIAEAVSADLFEIVPTEVYTSDDLNWTNADSRVSREHDDESLRDVPLTTTEVPDWDSYDTVFIGYPIWWGQTPKIVYTFLENYDLSGKTVIPFATSGGSGMGGEDILKAACSKDTKWLPGKRLSSRESAASVQKWVESLGL